MTNHTIVVRGIEYKATESLGDNKIQFTDDDSAVIQYIVDFIGLDLPRDLTDAQGNLTGQTRRGKIRVSYLEAVKIGKRYSIAKGGDVFSHEESYELQYSLNTSQVTGSTVHKAAINGVAEVQVGQFDDSPIFFNPLKDFEPFQPIIFDVRVEENLAFIDIVDATTEEDIVYSLDGFETSLPLDSEGITLEDGNYKIGVLSQADGFPFFKEIRVKNN